MAKSSCIEFIRHGLPVGGSRYRGNRIDDALSYTGWQQMWDAMGQDNDWDRVVTSPLSRCRAFAELYASRHAIDCSIEADLKEVGFGSWEGQTKQSLIELDAAAFERFYQDPVLYRPEGAEPLQQLRDRVGRVFDRLHSEGPDQRTLVVAHAGVMRAVISHVLHTPLQAMYRIKINNAARIRFDLGQTIQLVMD